MVLIRLWRATLPSWLRLSELSPMRLEDMDVLMSRRKGRRMGMHWTIIVPATSAEYHIFDIPFRPGEDLLDMRFCVGGR